MTINFNTNRVTNITIIIVAILICILFYFRVTHTSVPFVNTKHETYTATSVLKPFDPAFSTELPYSKYQELTKKTLQIRDLKNGTWPGGGGAQFGWFMATSDGIYCDTCTVGDNRFSKFPDTKQSYILLPGWRLNPQPNGHYGLAPSEFHVEKGQSYVRKFITDKTIKKSNGYHYTVHQVDEPVKFRYDSKKDCIMIPVTSSVKEAVSNILLGVFCIITIYGVYLIAAFLKFIIDVSRGLSFTTNNINRLRLIAFSLLGFPVLMFLLTLLTRLIFNSYFTNDIVLNSGVWSNSWQGLCAGIVFLLLFKAFKQGKAFKEELDLTV